MVRQKRTALLKEAETKLDRVGLPCESRRQLTKDRETHSVYTEASLAAQW